MLTSFLSSFLVGLLVTAFLRLAGRYLPAPKPEPGKPDRLEMERLGKTRQLWTVLIFVLTVVLAVASGFLWFFLFSTLGDYVMSPGSEVVFQIDPRHFFWCLPAFFMGIISGGLLGDFGLRRFAGDRYAAYRRYSQENSGIDGARLMRWTVPLTVLLTLVFVVCQVCDVTRFSSVGVTLGHFGQFSHPSYSYSQVKALSFLPLTLDAQGHVKDRPEFQIDFKDGTSWTTESFFRDMSPAYDRRVFEYVAAKSGVPITRQDRASR